MVSAGLSDADVGLAPTPSTAPTSSAAQATAFTDTGQPGTPLQSATIGSLNAAGGYDPKQPPGTIRYPYALRKGDPPPPAGAWYMDSDGRISQAPNASQPDPTTASVPSSQPPISAQNGQQGLSDADVGITGQVAANPQAGGARSDELLGFTKGITTPILNGAKYIEGGLESLGVPVPQIDHALGGQTANEMIAAEQAKYANAAAQNVKPGALGEFAGNMVGTAFVPGGPAVQGAISGALNSTATDPIGVAKDAAFSALGGKIGDGVLRAAGAVIAPKLAPAVQALADVGVRMTPGQLIGGASKKVEDLFAHLPLLGNMVGNARSQSYNDFNRAAVNRTLTPIGEALPASVSTGHDAVQYATSKLGDAYEAALKPLTASTDGQLTQGIANIGQSAHSVLPPDVSSHLDSIVRNRVIAPLSGSSVSGPQVQSVLSDLGQIAARSHLSPSPWDKQLGDSLTDIQGEIRDWVARQNPAVAGQLNAANEGWANLVRVRRAAANASDGVFSPAQLATSVRVSDGSAGKGAVARGEALMQDLSSAGQKVLPNKQPNSGTPMGHAMQLGAAAILGGPHVAEHISPAAIAGAAAMALPYLKPSLSAINTVATSARPAAAQQAAKYLAKATPLLSRSAAVGVPFLTGDRRGSP